MIMAEKFPNLWCKPQIQKVQRLRSRIKGKQASPMLIIFKMWTIREKILKVVGEFEGRCPGLVHGWTRIKIKWDFP